MKTFAQTGTEVGKLVQQKNAAYGSSFAKAGHFLRLLFPKGIPADRFEDALLLVRIFDKQMRVATDKDAFGESPYGDISGYGILGVSLHQEIKARCPGSANGSDAANPPKVQPASAVSSTSEPITTNGSETNAPTISQPGSGLLESSSARESTPAESAHARTVLAAAIASEVARAKHRNDLGLCANGYLIASTHHLLGKNPLRLVELGAFHGLGFCSQHCVRVFKEEL